MPAKVIRHFDRTLVRHAPQRGSEASNVVHDRPLTWANTGSGAMQTSSGCNGLGSYCCLYCCREGYLDAAGVQAPRCTV
jgi:hypothetical protein